MHKIFSHTLFPGGALYELPECDSTNSVANELIRQGKARHGDVVVAVAQTAGRGQRGNGWESGPGQNLTLSLTVSPDFIQVTEQFDLSVLTALSIRDLLVSYFPPEWVKVKWPNDVYVESGKISGTLIENTLKGREIDFAVVGIGLNVNQRDFQTPNAVSMASLCGQEFDLNEIMGGLCRNFARRFVEAERGGTESQLREYLDCLYWIGEARKFRNTATGEVFEGTITGVGPMGELKMKIRNVERLFDVKGVEFLA
ncbi:biotin--[acetyl-CoA-carboxylase] ligase [Fulvitalea axinellae]|uniref:Biotin--[acetyl-CoA-carboxylase] ligase n=1 Tax=Fulvitalea axinellae TaxID=1182444 RepID=A0AAU9CM77_9BACT|nr:biotin--[acetyl-CoA-carboxylase] ligase [Fulvitalea axinellae]